MHHLHHSAPRVIMLCWPHFMVQYINRIHFTQHLSTHLNITQIRTVHAVHVTVVTKNNKALLVVERVNVYLYTFMWNKSASDRKWIFRKKYSIYIGIINIILKWVFFLLRNYEKFIIICASLWELFFSSSFINMI